MRIEHRDESYRFYLRNEVVEDDDTVKIASLIMENIRVKMGSIGNYLCLKTLKQARDVLEVLDSEQARKA